MYFSKQGTKQKKRKIQGPEETEDLKGSPGVIADPQVREQPMQVEIEA